MGVVVTGTCSDHGDQVEVAKLGHRVKSALADHHVEHLSNISAVQIVVVRHFRAIAGADRHQELDKFLEVQRHGWCREILQVCHHLVDKEDESIFSTYSVTDLESIEIKSLDSVKHLLMLQKLLLKLEPRLVGRVSQRNVSWLKTHLSLLRAQARHFD